MIQFDEETLSLSPAVARALLAFASTDEKRPHICSIGIDQGELCASDGHTAIRFDKGEPGDGPDRMKRNGRYFERMLVEAALEKAGRKGPVVLEWSQTMPGFVRLHQVEPRDGVAPLEKGLVFDASYLARLELAAKACRREREKGEVDVPPLPGVVLTSLGGWLEPMRWCVGGPEWGQKTAHVAWVTIMPMRPASATQAQVKAANRKSLRQRKAALGSAAKAVG